MSEPLTGTQVPAPTAGIDHFFQLADAWLPFLGGLAGAFVPGAAPVIALVAKLDSTIEAALAARKAVAGEPYNADSVSRIP